MGAPTRWCGGRGLDRGRWRLAVLAVLLVAGVVVSIGPSGPGGPPDAAAAVQPEHAGEAAGRGPSGPTGVLAPDGRWTAAGRPLDGRWTAAGRPLDGDVAHRWSFRSAGDRDAGLTRIPLLVVDYGLPLDPLNHLTSRTATFTVRQVTGAESQDVERLRVWTSTDDGTTWTAAQVQRRSGGGGDFGVTLPDVAAGTGVSLRVDARDAAGNRIEQTLLDAYTG